MYILPSVKEGDYPALRGSLGRTIPATYVGWLAMLAEIEATHSHEGVLHLPVSPAAFAEYVLHAGQPLNFEALLDYVAFNPWHDPD